MLILVLPHARGGGVLPPKDAAGGDVHVELFIAAPTPEPLPRLPLVLLLQPLSTRYLYGFVEEFVAICPGSAPKAAQ